MPAKRIYICLGVVFLSMSAPPSMAPEQAAVTAAKAPVDQQAYEAATAPYQEKLAPYPDDVDTLLELGRLNVRLGHRKEAIELYRRALTIEPDNQPVKVALAFAYLFENELPKSEHMFRSVLDEAPDNADAFAGLAQIAMAKGDLPAAEQFLNSALDADPANVTARIYLGNLRLRQQRTAEAKTIFTKLTAEDPGNPDAQQGLLNADRAEKQDLEAGSKEKTLPKTAAAETEDPLAKKAAQLRQQKQYKAAAALYEELVAAHPQNVDYLLSLGRLYVSIDRRKEAIELYERALALQPERQDIRTSLAYAYLFENKLEKSQRLFQTVLAQEPKNADALAGLGNIAIKKDQLQEADNDLQTAIKIDPKNIAALTYLANLKMRLKEYAAAHALYAKIVELEPDNPDALQGLVEVREKPLVEKAKQLLKNKQYEQAQALYKNVLHSSPKNVDYLAGLALVYKLQGRHLEAIELLQQALALDPNRQDIRTSLAFVYLFTNKLDASRELFQTVLTKEPNNPDALAGMGRIAARQEHPEEAESYYLKALKIDPNNATALEFQGILKLQQKQYHEAFAIYEKLLSIDPTNTDYRAGLRDAQELPIFERAKKLRDDKDHAEAAALIEQLIAQSPQRIDYYLVLGQIYVHMGQKDKAIELYNQGLTVKAHDKDLLKALGFTHLNTALEEAAKGTFKWKRRFPFVFGRGKTDLCLSQQAFEEVLEQDPLDASALAGMGRIALIEGSDERAEALYFDTLHREPANTTALAYLAALQSQQKKYFTADDTYRTLLHIAPDDEDTIKNYKEFLHAKRPSIDFTVGYEEENEKDQITQQWDARLKNYGAGLTIIYPIKDQLKLVGNMTCDYIVLKNLLNRSPANSSIYSLDVQRPKLGLIWNCSPYLSLTGGMALAIFSHYHHSSTFTKRGCYWLPFFNISYNKNFHTCSFETLGDAPIVARNFLTNQSTLIARQFLNGAYEYDLGKRRTIGASASYAWYYNRIKDNQFQLGSAWLQITPPRYWENISLRYQFNYSRFNDLTVDYYTFRPQTSHWLKVDLSKKWLDEKLVTEAGYAHCWQRSFENGQILAVVPTATFHWINRRINAAYARVKYMVGERLSATVTGTYSHDNFSYTTASVTGFLHMEF